MGIDTMRLFKSIFALIIASGATVPVHAGAPATAPTISATTAPTTAPVDSPDAVAVRQQLTDWDKSGATISLADLRKFYHTTTDREASFMDRIAHENWEECKTERAILSTWGLDAQKQFAHLLGDSILQDDEVCKVKVDGEHAVVSWDIKEIADLPMIKIGSHWFADGHVLFEDAIKDDPDVETNRHSDLKLVKQARADITSGKFDDFDSFFADFKQKMDAPTGGN
jgi:hypothetical protein